MSTSYSTPELVPIAFDELAERFLGQLEFIQKVLVSFVCRFQEDLEQLEKELSSRNISEVARLAHRMKGACGNMAAHQLQDTTAHIEQLAREDRISEIAIYLEKLQHEFTEFLSSAESFKSSDGTGLI